MRVLVTGDRNWTDRTLIWITLRGFKYLADQLDEVLYVIEGGASGADEAAREWAQTNLDHSVESITVEADWDKHGSRAGPIRNALMLKEHDPEFILAFHNDLENSKGTKHCTQLAESQGRVVYYYRSSAS